MTMQGYSTVDNEGQNSFVKREFTTLAPYYNVMALPIAGLREKVVDLANTKAGAKILDVATGTGKQAFAFAKSGYDVVGVDLTEAMLRRAIQENIYRNLSFEIADATQLPFEDDRFDVACISFALHLMPLPIGKRVLAEMGRVTRRDGLIMIVDATLPKRGILRALLLTFMKFYGNEHLSHFMKSDLAVTLRESNIQVERELPVLWGVGKIIKGSPVQKETWREA